MLELCATRGDHDAVVEGEAVAHLRRLPADSVDVIVAADVLAYIGDCAELFGEAHRVLRTNGRLVFTLEEGDAGFGLGPGGRFVHSERVFIRSGGGGGAARRGPGPGTDAFSGGGRGHADRGVGACFVSVFLYLRSIVVTVLAQSDLGVRLLGVH